MQGDQGGGAGCVNGERRAAQPENVGDAAGGHVQGRAGAEVGVELLQPAAFEQAGVVGVGNAHEDPGAAAAQTLRVDTTVFKGVPGRFQQQPLLRVEAFGLPRRNVEERRVEARDVGEETTLVGGDRSGPQRVVVMQRSRVETVGGNRSDRVPAHTQLLPELFEGVRPGETAGHADDRDEFARRLPTVRRRQRHVAGCGGSGWHGGSGRHGGRSRPRGRGRAGGRDPGDNVPGQFGDGRVVEDLGDAHLDIEGDRQLAREVHRHDRIHSEVEEADVLAYGSRLGVAEDHRQQFPHGVTRGTQARSRRHVEQDGASRGRSYARLGAAS